MGAASRYLWLLRNELGRDSKQAAQCGDVPAIYHKVFNHLTRRFDSMIASCTCRFWGNMRPVPWTSGLATGDFEAAPLVSLIVRQPRSRFLLVLLLAAGACKADMTVAREPAPDPTPDSTGFSIPVTIDATGTLDVTGALTAFFASVPDGSTIVFPKGADYRGNR